MFNSLTSLKNRYDYLSFIKKVLSIWWILRRMCIYGGGSILLSMSFQVKSILNSSLTKGRGKRQNTSWEKVGQVRKIHIFFSPTIFYSKAYLLQLSPDNSFGGFKQESKCTTSGLTYQNMQGTTGIYNEQFKQNIQNLMTFNSVNSILSRPVSHITILNVKYIYAKQR